MRRREVLASSIGLTGLGGVMQPAGAQGRTVELIVPYAAGGASDIVGRALIQRLAPRLGHRMVVINVGGAGATLGTDRVAKSAPDGNTMVLVASAHTIVPFLMPSIPYRPIEDFEAVILLGYSANVLVVNADLPIRSFAEFIAAAKARPGQINFGSAGLAGFQGALMVLMGETGIEVHTIPFRSGTEAATEVVAGRVDAMWANVLEVSEHVKAGRLRALAATSPQRSPLLPDVPTMIELGYPNFHSDSWLAILMARGTPEPIVSATNQAVNAVLQEDGFRERLASLGYAPAGGTPQEARRFLQSEMDRWEPIVRRSGARAT